MFSIWFIIFRAHLEASIYGFLIKFCYICFSDNALPTHLSISKSFHGYSFLVVSVENGTNIYGVLNVFYMISPQIYIDIKIFIPIT